MALALGVIVLLSPLLIILGTFIRLLFKPIPPSEVAANHLPSTARVLTTFIAGSAVAFGIGFALLYPRYSADVAIRQHGQRAEAQVLNSYVKCSRGGCGLRVQYRYARPGSAGSSAYLTGLYGMPDPAHDAFSNDVYARQIDRIPIVYDIDDPSSSTIDYPANAIEGRPKSDLFFMLFLCLGFSPFAGLIALACRGLIVPSPEARARAAAQAA